MSSLRWLSGWSARAIGLGACVAMLVALTAPAGAGTRSTIEVHPGPHAIANALAGANPGDVLNIHAGTYKEHVTVHTKNVTLQAAGDGKVVVDGRCRTRYTIYVIAGGVSIDGLTVKGADEGFGLYPAEVDFETAATGSVQHSVLRDSCNAEYGVSVYNSGAIDVSDNSATGFSDSGIYIGNISSTGTGVLFVRSNQSYGSSRGVIVENSAGGTIRVITNALHDNDSAGIFVTNSDGVKIRGNMITNNGTSGIELDPASDHNRVIGNTVSGHTYDLRNDGPATNCWRDNTYTTSFGPVSC